MFGLKIVKRSAYDNLIEENEELLRTNNKLRNFLKSSEQDLTNKTYCTNCKHCINILSYYENGNLMGANIICDLDCDCENFERKK